MTRDSELIGLIEGYLDDVEGHTYLPDSSRDAIRAQLPSTTQRPPWWPGWRFPDMNTMMKYGLGAAAAVVVAILGVQLFGSGAGIGCPPAATPTVAPTPTAEPEAMLVIGEGMLTDAEVTTPKPDGWTLEANFANKDGTATDGIGYSAWTTVAVHADPCRWADDDMSSSAVPTVEDIVAGLLEQRGRDPRPPTQVTLGGWSATRIELITPAELDISTCDQGRYKAWTDVSDPEGGNWNHQSGQYDVVHVVDVDGTPVVIDAWYNPSTSAADLAELESLLAAMVNESE